MFDKNIVLLILTLIVMNSISLHAKQNYDYNLYFKEFNKYGSLKYFSGQEFYNSPYRSNLEGVGFKIERQSGNIYMFSFFYKLNNKKNISPFFYYREIDMHPYNVLIKVNNIKQFKSKGFLTNETDLISEILNSPLEMIKIFLLDEVLLDDRTEKEEIPKSSIKLYLSDLKKINSPAIIPSKKYLSDFFINIANISDETESLQYDKRINLKERYVTQDDILEIIFLVDPAIAEKKARLDEKVKLKVEQEKKLQLEKQKAEKEEQAKQEKIAEAKKEKERQQEIEKERQNKIEQARLEAERQEKLKTEQKKKIQLEKQKAEKKQQEKLEKIAAEQKEKERQQKVEKEQQKKIDQARLEAERQEKLKAEKKKKIQLIIVLKKENFEEIDLRTMQFEYFIESNSPEISNIRDFLDISSSKIIKEIEVIKESKVEIGFYPPKGFSINGFLSDKYCSVFIDTAKQKQKISLSIKKLEHIPILFIDKSEIAPVEWVGVEKIIKHIKKQVRINDKYGIFYVSGEKLFGKFYNIDDKDFEDFIWETIFLLPTSSGVRFEHILPLGNKWLKSDWNQQYYPEIHLFLSQATLKSYTTKVNSSQIIDDFAKNISNRMKEKNVSIIYHHKKDKKNQINFRKLNFKSKWIK